MERTIIDDVTIWTSTRVMEVATSESVLTEARDEFKRQTASSEPSLWLNLLMRSQRLAVDASCLTSVALRRGQLDIRCKPKIILHQP